jgi:hypothetical protein
MVPLSQCLPMAQNTYEQRRTTLDILRLTEAFVFASPEQPVRPNALRPLLPAHPTPFDVQHVLRQCAEHGGAYAAIVSYIVRLHLIRMLPGGDVGLIIPIRGWRTQRSKDQIKSTILRCALLSPSM